MSGHRIERRGPVVHAVIEGRATGAAIDDFAAVLSGLVDAGERFAVLFDRRPMTAPTADGRAALERWGETLTPRLPGHCVGWADLYDERRAASLARAAESGDPDEPGPYEHRVMTDPDAASEWLALQLQVAAVDRTA